jgi:tetrapyrrole methylase family protein/MazG family protein
MDSKNTKLNNLISTIEQLRGPEGCPWDKKQTVDSLTEYLNEEVAELLAAIKNHDAVNICEETGDILYILIMISEIHADKNIFSFSDVITEINNKLIRRHPHVFAGKKVVDEEQLRRQWEFLKLQEKQKK